MKRQKIKFILPIGIGILLILGISCVGVFVYMRNNSDFFETASIAGEDNKLTENQTENLTDEEYSIIESDYIYKNPIVYAKENAIYCKADIDNEPYLLTDKNAIMNLSHFTPSPYNRNLLEFSKNREKILYISEEFSDADSYIPTGVLYCADISNTDDGIPNKRISSDVYLNQLASEGISYYTNSDCSEVFYIKNDNLYRYNFFESVFIDKATYIEHYSEETNRILYSHTEYGYNYEYGYEDSYDCWYTADLSSESPVITAMGSGEICNYTTDLSHIYYIYIFYREHPTVDLYHITLENEPELILEGIDKNITIYDAENLMCIYSVPSIKKVPAESIVSDLYSESDSEMNIDVSSYLYIEYFVSLFGLESFLQENIESEYIQFYNDMLYDAIDSGEITWNDLNTMRREASDDYVNFNDAHLDMKDKLRRDIAREDIKGKEVEFNYFDVFFYENGESTLIAEEVFFPDTIIIDKAAPVVVYSQLTEDIWNDSMIGIYDISGHEELQQLVYDFAYTHRLSMWYGFTHTTTYIVDARTSNRTALEGFYDMVEFKERFTTNNGKYIFYSVEFDYPGTSCLYRCSWNEDGTLEMTEMAYNLYDYAILDETTMFYLSNHSNNTWELYICENGEYTHIGSDVGTFIEYVPSGKALFFMTDYQENTGSGNLYSYINGKKTFLSPDVYDYMYISENDIFILGVTPEYENYTLKYFSEGILSDIDTDVTGIANYHSRMILLSNRW